MAVTEPVAIYVEAIETDFCHEKARDFQKIILFDWSN